MDKKFEVEVPRILKSLGYPFTLSKSAMFTIGSIYTWPTMLGVLQWLVDCLKVCHCFYFLFFEMKTKTFFTLVYETKVPFNPLMFGGNKRP